MMYMTMMMMMMTMMKGGGWCVGAFQHLDIGVFEGELVYLTVFSKIENVVVQTTCALFVSYLALM